MRNLLASLVLSACFFLLLAADQPLAKWQYGLLTFADMNYSWESSQSQFAELDAAKLLSDLENHPVDKASYMEILNALGSQGWELVAIEPLGGDDKKTEFIFKRQVH